ncbi:MAG: copper-binding protein [Zymomonas mobilis subsp. pomaceae]|uniref:Cation efflux system protein CusF n=1 Tax=Zymomonas mobilis subsp. pomaceae (strain ATCC 29192 / DSM 22645 / JCM 10191 / CCUG 17912 / NBRC 13757 / NCIMB 11200 / NRRL B-4491 / Barker I) TaxID=579138 RepID=F8EVX4_ZYMMT|nr:copper-binding protein [Zymomonas mobilis]AEI37451.1 conserved hypothetical protein [Zymomonas mobilis subsp. pomaceae ATCC 29192]MDX5948818.1 copper-binding protein [Zymomonas mobilis subsp. pomaceae]GEB88626.1 hypothetical protein ZMO02_02630 [Zymomonas mobilis subsp. pomaceae]
MRPLVHSVAFLSFIATVPVMPALAQTDMDRMSMGHGTHSKNTSETIYSAQGTIKALDKTTVAIAHAAIPALSWPPMTMSFKLADKKQASLLKIGQNVRFSFKQVAEGYQITSISPK